MSTLKINEIFYSIQGESTHVGVPCIFIRFSGCIQNCSFCDSKYAWDEGFEIEPHEILIRIRQESLKCKNVCITGGEPFEQREGLSKLVKLLDDNEYNVCIETNGVHYIGGVPGAFIAIMDIKCPSSEGEGKFDLDNLEILDHEDNLKFVAYIDKDFEFIEKFLSTHKNEIEDIPILISPVLTESQFVNEERMKNTADEVKRLGNMFPDLDIRMQIQIHKIIWGAMTRGV